jgi:hypothetical protein
LVTGSILFGPSNRSPTPTTATPPGGWTAAADLLREVCTGGFGSVEHAVASGLALRYDGGSCFRSDHYQAEIDHLGIARSPAFHYEPETNGCAEKAIQTLKEQVLWIERASTRSTSSEPPSAPSAAPTTNTG